MQTVTLEHAQLHLAELIAQLQPGQELSITRGDQPLAKLVAAEAEVPQPRKAGSAKGRILHMSDDFDAPLEDFREYME